MPPREVNNARVESALWEACLRLRNDELGKKLYAFMKRTWLAALSDLKKNAEAPRRDEERREHFAKAFISDTLWRLYQSAESGTLDISEEDTNKMFNDVFGRPNIFPEEAGGHLSPPPRRWELIADVVKETFLEVTDAKVKDSTGPKPKKRKPAPRKPPGSGQGSGKAYSSWAKKNSEAASSQDVPFWYRKLISMDHKDDQSSRPPPPPRWHRSPEGSEGRWEGGDWRWKSTASSTRSVISTPGIRRTAAACSRSRSQRAPGWRKSSRSRGRRRRGGQRHRGAGKRGNSRRRDAPARTGRRRSEARKSRGRSLPGDRKEPMEAKREPASKSPKASSMRSSPVKSRKASEASKPPKASDSSECSTPRAAKSKASKASKATKESQAEEAQEEAKQSRDSTSMEESEDEKSQAKEMKLKEEQEDGSASGGIRLTEAKDVVRENENEDKDMFDELDDVGLMAHLQGTLKVSVVDNESVEPEDGGLGVETPVEDTEPQDDTADTEPCVNLAKGICLNKEAPECKTAPSFEVEDRGGVFRGMFCHSCSKILERGWALEEHK